MKKLLYIIPFIAMAVSSCNNNEDIIFEKSAAERLSEGREIVANKLTSNGGLWAMEYFSNEDEPGYVILFRFSDNGSVEISANHKWIDNQFRQETSMWKMISDNGTVVSFNTYNSLFHLFSDPANITGPLAPINPNNDKDIDETGYGHSGDYEFMVMNEKDENLMRLVGKKTGYNIYMHRLPDDTDEQAYLKMVRDREKIFFSEYFPTLIITEKQTGERFVATSEKGVMTVYPEKGSQTAQGKSMNYVVTQSGIRFAKPFVIERAENGETEMKEFAFTEDGGLDCAEFEFSLPIDNYEELFFNKSYTWNLDFSELSCPEFTECYSSFKTAFDKAFKKQGWKLTGMKCYYDAQTDSNRLMFVKSGSSAEMTFVRKPEIDDKGGYKFNVSLTDGTDNGLKCLSTVPQGVDFINLLNSKSFRVVYQSKLAPNVVTLTSLDDSNFHFNMYLE